MLKIYFATLMALLTTWASADEPSPIVRGGIGDKPFMAQAGRTRLGGYTEAHFRYERAAGFIEDLTFEAKRFNLFTYTSVSDRVRVASELEFEEGGEEIKVEMALLDFEIHPALIFRAGILLSPLGRFNLAHDSPANELTDRPLVSTELIPTALSEAGMGIYGALFPKDGMRITYELYGVNGFDEGLLFGDEAGTRFAAGRGNFEDNNSHPSLVGRIGVSPLQALELGLSVHTGPYNVWKVEGLEIDERRVATIWAFDWDGRWRRWHLQGEYVGASIDVPAESAVFQGSQNGYYAELSGTFGKNWLTALPGSLFAGVLRLGAVDFDADGRGDDVKRQTMGLNFRPHVDTVFKFDYQRTTEVDPFANELDSAAVLFSAATYF
ncbi:MAG: hypothetical protein ACI8P2_001914 [Candidatus Latescibacterota bacterium]|jgi:hypothetical protein